jgi:thiosulfate/3-mercaptopyruvate sulfurtransferase
MRGQYAEWLSKNLENPKVRVFEVSVDPGIYERGHIPGAVSVRAGKIGLRF